MVVVAVLLAPLAVGSLWVLSNVESSTAGNADVVVEVQQGWTPAQVGDALQQAGVIDSSAEFQAVAVSSGYAGGYPAGRYDFVADSTPARRSTRCAVVRARVVPDLELLLPPGLTIGQIAERVGKLEGKSAERFLAAATSGVVRSRYEPGDVNSLEGLTWPDTYFIGANETEDADPPEDRRPVRCQGRRARPRRLGRGERWAVAVPGGDRARRSSRRKPAARRMRRSSRR